MKKAYILVFLFPFLLNATEISKAEDLRSRLENHVRILSSDSLKGRGLGTEGAKKAREYIIRQFSEAGIQPLPDPGYTYLQAFNLRIGLARVDAYNIIGYIEGSDPELKDEFILLGAHYDHLGYEKDGEQKKIFPGADDNASGVAAIIELGRYFSENRDQVKRSLLFVAFDAEESGLLGSKHFVENSPLPLEQIKLMFSFDMVGMYQSNRGLHLRGINSMENGASIAEKIAETHSLNLRNTSSDIARMTDTAPFGDAGIPAVHAFTGTQSPYHKPEDQYHLLEYEGMIKIHHFMTDLIRELGAKEQIVPASALLSKAGTTGFGISTGFIVNTGSGHHRYTEEFFRANSVFSFAGGFYLQIPLNQTLTIQQEFLYDYNGSKIDGGSFRRHSVTLPFNLQLGTPRIFVNPVRAYISAGPYYRYMLDGHNAGETIDFNVYNQQEWGYSFSVGIDIIRLSFGYTYRRSLTGIWKDNHGPEVVNSNNYYFISYRF